jgi:hypothetical protein
MPKVTIDFTLPEEQHAYDLANNAAKIRNGITEFDNYLRQQITYGSLTQDESMLLQQVRGKLWETLNG